MDTEGKTIWQVAAGNGEHTNYAKLCLDKDVIIVGSGSEGPWPDCEIALRRKESALKVGITRRFAEDIKPGDLVVLRVGTQRVYGVGEVVGGYAWSEKFGRVQGWDLQHYRRVRWLWHQGGKPKVFPVYTLKLGSSVQYLISADVRRWLESLSVSDDAFSRELAPL